MATKMESLFGELAEYFVFDAQKYTLEEFMSDIKTFKNQFKVKYFSYEQNFYLFSFLSLQITTKYVKIYIDMFTYQHVYIDKLTSTYLHWHVYVDKFINTSLYWHVYIDMFTYRHVYISTCLHIDMLIINSIQ